MSNKSIFTGDLKQRFFDLIKLDHEKDLSLGLNKQKLTSALLHRKLRSEGFDVGITTIQIEFNKYKTNYLKSSDR